MRHLELDSGSKIADQVRNDRTLPAFAGMTIL